MWTYYKKYLPIFIQIIQIDSRHLLPYYMPISLVYYYTGVFCDIWTLLLVAFDLLCLYKEFKWKGLINEECMFQIKIPVILPLNLTSLTFKFVNETTNEFCKKNSAHQIILISTAE